MRPWKALLVVVMVAFATTLTAQQSIAPPMSAQRSYEIQAQLQAIDADRAAWVSRFLAQWSPYVDSSAYDIYEELTPILMKAPAWQVYGASLVGDFNTMLSILTGGRGAGPYINRLSEPQPKIAIGPTWSSPVPDSSSFAPPTSSVLGSTSDNLVFTPIPPCRIVDTRGTGARTGPIIADAPGRAFDLTTGGYTKGQGGATAGCTGLPSFSASAWAVNITATGYNQTGGLKAWPFSGTEPNASIINYSALIYPAIANGQDLTGCWGCGDDIVIKAFTASTHVIIDVVGYFREAFAPAAATVSRVAGTAFNTASTTFFSTGGACPAGTLLVGGEMDHNNGDLAMGEMREVVGTSTWTFWMINNTGGSVSGTPYSRCMDQPVRVW